VAAEDASARKELARAWLYAGHGLALASAAGQWVADAITGLAGPGTPLLRRRRLPWPPEPLRWLAFTAAVRLLALRDAAVDRRARRSAWRARR
jgi:hypothetical protein